MTVTTERAEECALGLDAIKENAAFIGYQYIADNCAIVLRSLAAERDDLAKRLKDAERERNHQHIRADRNAAQWAEQQAKREQLRDAINAALTEETSMEDFLWSQEPIGPNETPAEAIKRLIKFRVKAGCIAERDALRAENEKLREALTNAAAVIGSFYAFAETADAVSISGIARCHAMLTSMKKNRRRIEETVMQPARAALGKKE